MTIKIIKEQPNTTKGKYYENARYNRSFDSYIVKGDNFEMVSVNSCDCEVIQDESDTLGGYVNRFWNDYPNPFIKYYNDTTYVKNDNGEYVKLKDTGEMFDVHKSESFTNNEQEVKDEHYKKKVEPIDLIEAFELNFNLANVIKYVARCNHKGSKQEDLRKAMYYLKREMYKK